MCLTTARLHRRRVRELTLAGAYGKRAEVGGEVAENTFVKEGGIWKIRSEHQYTTFWADYTKGWSRGYVPIAGPSSGIPADKPPTEVYAAFPDYYVPPFHYANPVLRQTDRSLAVALPMTLATATAARALRVGWWTRSSLVDRRYEASGSLAVFRVGLAVDSQQQGLLRSGTQVRQESEDNE